MAGVAAAPIDRPPGNRAPLAPQGLAAVLDLEVAREDRPAAPPLRPIRRRLWSMKKARRPLDRDRATITPADCLRRPAEGGPQSLSAKVRAAMKRVSRAVATHCPKAIVSAFASGSPTSGSQQLEPGCCE